MSSNCFISLNTTQYYLSKDIKHVHQKLRTSYKKLLESWKTFKFGNKNGGFPVRILKIFQKFFTFQLKLDKNVFYHIFTIVCQKWHVRNLAICKLVTVIYGISESDSSPSKEKRIDVRPDCPHCSLSQRRSQLRSQQLTATSLSTHSLLAAHSTFKVYFDKSSRYRRCFIVQFQQKDLLLERVVTTWYALRFNTGKSARSFVVKEILCVKNWENYARKNT